MDEIKGTWNVSVHPRALKCYFQPFERYYSARYSSSYNSIPVNHQSLGLISSKSAKRINASIDWLLAQSKIKRIWDKKLKRYFTFRVNFLTLTLSAPQIHTDNEIKHSLLNTMLVHLRQKWGVKYYLWRAEAQLNGNIHFHIICDKYVPWWELRYYWNKVQNNLGYIDRFEAIHGHRDPNSTDVHSVKRIKNLAAYVSKEVSKNSKGTMYTALQWIDNRLKPCYNPQMALDIPAYTEKMYRSIQGSLWNQSGFLSRIKAKVLVIANQVRDELTKIRAKFPDKIFEGDYFEVIYVPVLKWASVIKGVLFDTYQGHLQELRVGVSNQQKLLLPN